ncbi:CDP-diacylglycerol--glycerol-3-phosphate 3-phosphatidyltransferase [Stygiobacter electus]|uniref:CDP-diacylglycerol--glycerol-3-phosphate 3-phosphatidyltransferase n=1 Tax=Stygiobacter electus TaxID=3032292 RepID=A0AAE3TEN8_9BACT|nr:CDP-diacylglycerol--glycerol-3-phosphate 3-phosphatidyltransferase [Stygiobacter electus]MDF1612468.1 CDP-diacylglycerol--glycerol-3-phosphate 3-phosphatidyltransferase [Stygiobacter electus]
MVLPNQLTVLRIILTPIFLVLFISGEPFLIQISLFVFLIAALTDWYDGWLARKFNYITDWGKFMDPLADKILTSTAFFAFVATGLVELWMVILIVFRDIVITLLRIYADYKKITFSTSYFAKIKTFLQMFFLYYLLVIYSFSTIDYFKTNFDYLLKILLNRNLVFYSMLSITIITVISGITYFFENKTMLKKLFE